MNSLWLRAPCALLLLASCDGDAATVRAGSDAGALGSDSGAAPLAPDAGASRMSYSPAGCRHSVRTEEGTTDNVRGDRATFGADAAPRRVHVTWPADPATTIAALWSTDPGTRASVMQYGTSPRTLDLTAVGHVSTGGLSSDSVTVHEVHACGLTPDTTYYYRVGAEGHWSAVQSFKTAPAPGRADYDVNFAVSGDSRDDVMVWRLVQNQLVSSAGMRQPDFELFTGDAVFFGLVQSQWDAWLDGASATQRAMPFVLAHGNHEALSVNYLMQFAQPQSGDPEQSELYFSFDYGPVHFAVLNDSARQFEATVVGAELAWLRADLERAQANRARVPFIVVAHHKPPFASGTHVDESDTALVRATWPPVYEMYGVDLVFNGHEHNFEVSKNLDGQGRELSGRRGTVYYTSGGGGANLYDVTPRPWSRHSERVNNFLLVHATMRAITVTPHRGDGTVIEQGRVTLTPRI